jgi:hypothetical protein
MILFVRDVVRNLELQRLELVIELHALRLPQNLPLVLDHRQHYR